MSGTPAYMAPEQFDRTTGNSPAATSIRSASSLRNSSPARKHLKGGELNELISLRRSATTPTTPTSIVQGLESSD